ncbi:MAG: redox-sensing transcriptional repressor Rex [Saccharofermentanales bacterium]|jgi:redox-sensing transcriptional repressor
MPPRTFSLQTLERLPYYLDFLKSIDCDDVSAAAIAENFDLSDVQVRKDIAAVSSEAGRPRVGFNRRALIRDIEEVLGYRHINEAVIVGVGHLGTALINYKGFAQYGMKIVAGFDVKVDHETWIGDTPVFAADRMIPLIRRLNVQMGIIAVNADAAQSVCDRLIDAGIECIWNFAPVMLDTPEHIIVQNENMASSLAVLSHHLRNKRGNGSSAPRSHT